VLIFPKNLGIDSHDSKHVTAQKCVEREKRKGNKESVEERGGKRIRGVENEREEKGGQGKFRLLIFEHFRSLWRCDR